VAERRRPAHPAPGRRDGNRADGRAAGTPPHARCRSARPDGRRTSAVLAGRTLVANGGIKTVERAMEAAGGAGFYRGLGLERLFGDVQGARYIRCASRTGPLPRDDSSSV
jgi:acyl-CoA dehydrogenase